MKNEELLKLYQDQNLRITCLEEEIKDLKELVTYLQNQINDLNDRTYASTASIGISYT